MKIEEIKKLKGTEKEKDRLKILLEEGKIPEKVYWEIRASWSIKSKNDLVSKAEEVFGK